MKLNNSEIQFVLYLLDDFYDHLDVHEKIEADSLLSNIQSYRKNEKKLASTHITWNAEGVRTVNGVPDYVAQPVQHDPDPVAWITPDGEGFRIRFTAPVSEVALGWDALYTKSGAANIAQPVQPATFTDGTRLHYLIENRAYVVSDESCGDGFWLHYTKTDGSKWVQTGEYDTPRDAIDAALRGSRKND